ncbi:UNVERIFIED_CONTAM: hypothetical protein Sradi_6424600 [Sesamum radiatum]|uniref:Uncharacterized protein n=1 Tax=Sesamum radiatum TaxID=300843 RepID=A0AAW2K6H6_SESRA
MFTWCNRRESSHTARAHSDRACCNSCWAYLFQVAKVHHENFACSDHAALTVHMSEVTNLARKETMEWVLANMENRAIDTMNTDLTRPFSLEEIMRGLNQMHPLKSPDPDGMYTYPFKKSIIGPDTWACMLEFLIIVLLTTL